MTSLSSLSFPQAERRRAAILIVVALALTRSAPIPALKDLSDALSLKEWRETRKQRREERRRRERETPL